MVSSGNEGGGGSVRCAELIPNPDIGRASGGESTRSDARTKVVRCTIPPRW